MRLTKLGGIASFGQVRVCSELKSTFSFVTLFLNKGRKSLPSILLSHIPALSGLHPFSHSLKKQAQLITGDFVQFYSTAPCACSEHVMV